jgi:hypothetical protein
MNNNTVYKVIKIVGCTGQKLISRMAQLDGKATLNMDKQY